MMTENVEEAELIEEEEDEAELEEEELSLPKTFNEILPSDELRLAVSALGFEMPTPVQAEAVPIACQGKDLMIQAKTGSGKTLAFSLPLVHQLQLEEKERGAVDYTFGLVISPTRELAQQIVEVVNSLGAGFSPALIIGGVSFDKQLKALEKDCRIVVGTPGRVLDLLRQKKLRLKKVRFFVVDEADEMFSMGFVEDVRAVLSRLPNKRQGVFASATISPRVEMLAGSFLSKPQRVFVDEAGVDLPPIEHLLLKVGGDLMAKPSALCDFIETQRPRSAIIFCNTKSDTELVEVLLRRRGFDARRINSDLSQSQRLRVMDKIRAGDLQFLVATDIAARGIDIEQIDLVVNYSIPEQPEVYVHRTGRTGRAGNSGRALSLISARDFTAFHQLQRIVDADFNEIELPSDEDVAGARLSHLYEILRIADVAPKERDVLVARKLLAEIADLKEVPEELEEIVSKLCLYATEHYVAQEAKSLDEELKPAREQGKNKKNRGDDNKRKGDRKKDRKRRGDRRGRSRRER